MIRQTHTPCPQQVRLRILSIVPQTIAAINDQLRCLDTQHAAGICAHALVLSTEQCAKCTADCHMVVGMHAVPTTSQMMLRGTTLT